MQLKEAIELIWNNRKYDPATDKDAVIHLNEEIAESLKALQKGDKDTAQQELEDAFSCMLIAMKVLDINPEDAINRQIKRMKSEPERTMHIFSDRVEIRVSGEIKGKWAIWGPEDLKEAQKMAKEFKCKIYWEEATQLTIEDAIANVETNQN